MNCSLVQEKLSWYMDGILDEATLEAVEHHLEVCQACRNELALLQAVSLAASEIEAAELMDHVKTCPACERELQVLRSLSGAMTLVSEVNPPPDLRERIAAATSQAPRLKNLVARMLESLMPSKIGYAVAGTAAAILVAYMAIGPSTPPEPIVAKVQPNQPHSEQFTTPEKTEIAEVVEPEQTVVSAPKAPSAQQTASKPTHTAKVEESKPVINVAALREPHESKKIAQHAPVPTIEERTIAAKTDEQPKLVADSLETVPVEAVVAEAPETTPSQPLKLKPQEASISQSERLERFMKDVKIEVERRQKPDDYAKLDIIKITR